MAHTRLITLNGSAGAFVAVSATQVTRRVEVIEDGSAIVNDVPSKFLEKFETTELALRELRHLTSFGHMNTELRKTALPAS